MRAGESFLLSPPFQFVFKDFGCVAQTIKRFSFLYGDCPDEFFHQSQKNDLFHAPHVACRKTKSGWAGAGEISDSSEAQMQYVLLILDF